MAECAFQKFQNSKIHKNFEKQQQTSDVSVVSATFCRSLPYFGEKAHQMMEEEPKSCMTDQEIAAAKAEYVERCERECKEWKEDYKQKKKAQRLALAGKEKDCITYSSVEHALTDEEKELLAARPDYKGLLQQARNLAIKVAIVSESHQEAALKIQESVQEAQQIMDEVVLKIINRPPDSYVP